MYWVDQKETEEIRQKKNKTTAQSWVLLSVNGMKRIRSPAPAELFLDPMWVSVYPREWVVNQWLLCPKSYAKTFHYHASDSIF